MLKELRRAYLRAGREDQIVKSIRRDIEVSEQQFEPDSRFMAVRLLTLGRELIELEQFELAVEPLDRAGVILDSDPGSWDSQAASVLRHRAALAIVPEEMFQQTLASLETAFTRADALLSGTFPARRQELRQVAREVADLMEARSLNASAWQERSNAGVTANHDGPN